jgi:hypothetical protein
LAITTFADIKTALSVNREIDKHCYKYYPSSGTGAGEFNCSFRLTGTYGAIANPSSNPGDNYTSATGGITFNNDAVLSKFLTSFSATNANSSGNGVLFLFDVLYGCALALNSATTVNIDPSVTKPIQRYTSGLGVIPLLEVGVAISAAASPTISLSYTNHAGTGSITSPTYTIKTAAQINHLAWLPVYSGDLGVRSIQTATIANVGAAGSGYLWLVKPIAAINLLSTTTEKEFPITHPSLPMIYDGATLATAHNLNTSNYCYGNHSIRIIKG